MSGERTQREYEIRIRGRLSDSQVAAIGGRRADVGDANTTIVVTAPDRATLHSVLTRLEDFALELVSVASIEHQEPQ